MSDKNLSPTDTNVNFTLNVYDDPWEPRTSLPEPIPSDFVHKDHQIPLHYRAPASRSPTVPYNASPPTTTVTSNINNRSRNESRKLLSIVLDKLAHRSKPGSVIQDFVNTTHESDEKGFGIIADSLREAVQLGPRQENRSQKRSTIPPDDSDDEKATSFTTDETIELMIQLKDVLAMSVSQGWQIFNDSTDFKDRDIDPAKDSKMTSTFRRSRRISRSAGKRIQSSSPQRDYIRVPELLSSCLSILQSIVLEDCRFRVASPRPTRPPNTLQALTLNIAQFLIYSHRYDPRVISQIAFAMIPAFYTFPPQMLPRVLTFFEVNVVRTVLQQLAHLQGIFSSASPQEINDQYRNSTVNNDSFVVSIQIEKAEGDDTASSLEGDRQWTPPSSTMNEIQSTNNPRQPAPIYYLAFLIPPLLGAMLDSLNSYKESVEDVEITSRFTNLLELAAKSKVDAYNDLLEIIAYRDSKSRRMAIASLAKVWPNSTGHTVICTSFGSGLFHSTYDPYAHQFIPWSFQSNGNRVHLGGTLHNDCRCCSKQINGFALFCPSCMTAVHFDCYDYPDGNYEVQYSMLDDPRVQRIAMLRFSDLHFNANYSPVVTSHAHQLLPKTWFTLGLCFVCNLPLWGCFAQGFKCEVCNVALHEKCIPEIDDFRRCGFHAMSSRNMTIDWGTFRKSCLTHYQTPLCLSPQQLSGLSYEEISIFHGVLKTQLQIIVNGMEFGSIVIVGNEHDASNNPEFFELHRTIQYCENLLRGGTLPFSNLTQQYLQDTDSTNAMPPTMFDWSYLEYITSSIKTAFPQTRSTSRMASNLLNVENPVENTDEEAESMAYPYEATTLAHLRNILALDFTVRSEQAARFILNHLRILSFFDRVDHYPLPFNDISIDKGIMCMFPLPLGLDLSMNVETLVSAIEASLGDLDLSANEFGFLLLSRKFWPNGLASEYGLKRLAERVLLWILDEDSKLAIILREFVAKQIPLPGVCDDRRTPPWPPLHDLRPGSAGLSSTGGDYIASRRSLFSKYALPWLLELHHLRPLFYSQTVFDICTQAVGDWYDEDPDMLQVGAKERNLPKTCDDLLRSIIKLCQYSVVFSVFDDLFIRWMNFVLVHGQADKPMPSLTRFFVNENDPSQRGTFFMDSTTEQLDILNADPLRIVISFASKSSFGLSQSLSFLTSMVKSGITIPTVSLKQIWGLIQLERDERFKNTDLFLRAIVLSLWNKSMGRQDLQGLIASIHSDMASKILESLLTRSDASISISIIQQSLAACLRIYGCDRSSIITAGFANADEFQDLPSRRKTNTRGSGLSDPVFIEPDILKALLLYLQSNVDDVVALVAKFLNLFIMDSPFLEGFEVDNFILRNGKLVALCAWGAYDIQQEGLVLARTNLLLRSLLIDSEPFYSILHSYIDPSKSSMERRLSGLNRMFRMVYDVTSPAFGVEGRQWRSSVIEIFSSFFSTLWKEPEEEIRLAARSFSSTLLPVHFEAISQCWNESLRNAPVIERTRLVGFLIQLRPYFPSWKVLSWDSIIDTLMEYDYEPKTPTAPFVSPVDMNLTEKTQEKYNLSATDPDLSQLRVSVILLSLQMIADGIDIDSFSIMKLKVQFVQISGFSRVSVIPTQSGQSFRLQFDDISAIAESSYPCIEELIRIIDAPYYLNLPYTALGISDGPDDKTVNVLVGSTFLDTSLYIIGRLRSLPSLPVLTLKCLLETLHIAIHKYDFQDRLFQHFQPMLRGAVLKAIELLSKDISYELRQLSLSIAQAAIKKWHSFLGATISTILELVAAEVASQSRHSQDSLVVNGKLLIGTTLQTFCYNGLLLGLMRRQLQRDFFLVLDQIFNGQGKDTNTLPQSTCESLLRDTFARATECDASSFQTVLGNLATFVEVVYSKGYSSDLLMFVGQHLSLLVRRMSDGSIEHPDPSPLIIISVTIMENNRKNGKELIPYIDTVVRTSLNRLHVNPACITRLIRVTAMSRPKVKVQESVTGAIDLIDVLFEVLLDGLRMKTKILPITIKILIDCLLSFDDSTSLVPSHPFFSLFRHLTDDAYTFLQHYTWQEESIEHDFQAVVATGKLFLSIANHDPTILQRIGEQTQLSDKSRVPLGVRSWNVLLLVALQEGHKDWLYLLFGYFSAFGGTYSTILRSYIQSGITSPVAATTDINQAYISMKLWLMLANCISRYDETGEFVVCGVWNELWPPYEGFLKVLETEAPLGLYPTLTSMTCTSIADLFIYIHSLKSSLALEATLHIVILNRLRLLNQGDSASSKISRAIRTMTEPSSEVISSIILLDQIGKEFVAAEKIRIADSKRDHGRIGDRTRKDGRLATS